MQNLCVNYNPSVSELRTKTTNHHVILADRGTGQWHMIPAKAADKSTIWLLLAGHQQESLTVYIDGFRAYERLDEDGAFDRDTSFTVTANMPTTRFTSTPAKATRR